MPAAPERRSGSCCRGSARGPPPPGPEVAFRPPTVIDLFCGAGGLSLGFHAAGCRIRAAVDIDEAAGATFRTNFEVLQPDAPPFIMAGEDFDLEQMSLQDILAGASPPDIVIGGPPCQGF